MNKWKALAILFTLITLGAIKETFRILTSSSEDIASNRSELIIMAVILTSILAFFTVRFWKKSTDKHLH
jgi:hypothetical protein